MRKIADWVDWLDNMPRWVRRLAGFESAVSIGTWVVRGVMFIGIPALAWIASNPNILWGLVFPAGWVGLEYGLARYKKSVRQIPPPDSLSKTGVAASYSAATKPPVVVPSEVVAKSTDPIDLKALLQEELRQGENLLQRLHFQNLVGVMPMIDPPVTELVVDMWQDRVRDLLRSKPLKQARFDSDPIETYGLAFTSTFDVLYGGLDRRLKHRMAMLSLILQEL